uniref:Uncharacterized protein n=1 Tax=Moniliophthora roreri TaxID=221103 RepID=A0A0W0G3P2_MONRR
MIAFKTTSQIKMGVHFNQKLPKE